MEDHSEDGAAIGGDYGPQGNKLLKGMAWAIPLSILVFWIPLGLIVWAVWLWLR